MNLKSKWVRVLPAVLLLMGMLQLRGSQPAFASLPTTFELDGNACPDGGTDWGNLHIDGFPTNLTNPANRCPYTAAGANQPFVGFLQPDPYSPQQNDPTTFYTGSSKTTTPLMGWLSTTGSSPAKADITNSFTAAYNASGNLVVDTGLDRWDNSGDTNVGVWFFKSAVYCCNSSHQFVSQDPSLNANAPLAEHSNGDLLLESDFVQGGSVPSITVQQWQCTPQTGSQLCTIDPGTHQETGSLVTISSSNAVDCSAVSFSSTNYCAIVNHVASGAALTKAPWAYTDKSKNHDYLTGEFFEAGINISAVAPGDTCFASTITETQSATSGSVPAGQDFTLHGFNTCKAQMTITPHTATDSVGDTHTLTVATQASSDNGATYQNYGPSSISINLTSGSVGQIVGGTCFSPNPLTTPAGPGTVVNGSTGSNGTCTVQITNSTAGTSYVHGSGNVNFSGQLIPVSTGTFSATDTTNTTDAQKIWAAGSITLNKSVEVGALNGYPKVCFTLSYHSPAATTAPADIHITPISNDATAAGAADPTYALDSTHNTNTECHQYTSSDTDSTTHITSFAFRFHGLSTSHYDLAESLVPSASPWTMADTTNLINIAVDPTSSTIKDVTVTACGPGSTATSGAGCLQPANPLQTGSLKIQKNVNGVKYTGTTQFTFQLFYCGSNSSCTYSGTATPDRDNILVPAVDNSTAPPTVTNPVTVSGLKEGYWLVHEVPPALSTGYAVDPTTQNQVVAVYAGDCKLTGAGCDTTVTLPNTVTVNNKLLYKVIIETCTAQGDTLVKSGVSTTVGGTGYAQNTLDTAPSGLTSAQICELNPAFTNLLPGSYSFSVNVATSGTPTSPPSP